MSASIWNETIEIQHDVRINVVISRPSSPVPSNASPIVLFLHFWGGSIRTWSHVSTLIGGHLTTIALDFRGWGGSTGPDVTDAYTIEALAGDVQAVMTEHGQHGLIGTGGVVLVGLSMGAKVAQVVAALSHHTVRGTVLVSPAPATPLCLPPNMQEQQLHAYDSEEPAMFVAKNVLTESFYGDKTLPAFVVEDMLRGNRWARTAWPAYAMAEDVTATIMAGPSKPTLVLAAGKDKVEPLDRVKDKVFDRIPGAQLVILPDSGHLSPLDVPEAVAEYILRFVDELSRSVPG